VKENTMNPIVTISIRDRGNVTIELFPENAPNSVNSFISMIKKGVYTDQKICRIVKGYVIQPSYSDFENDDARYSIDGEFECNGYADRIKPVKGSVSLAGNGKDLSSGCCFYFVLDDNIEKLYGRYSVIGQITEGFDIISDIENVETFSVLVKQEGIEINEPVEAELILGISVETFGVTYDEPKKLETVMCESNFYESN